jgi:hypothetical protein
VLCFDIVPFISVLAIDSFGAVAGYLSVVSSELSVQRGFPVDESESRVSIGPKGQENGSVLP